MKLILVLMTLSLGLNVTAAFAGSELDSEINDLQVKIVRLSPKPKPVVKAVQRTTISPKIYSYSATPVRTQSTTMTSSRYYQAAKVPRPGYVASNNITPTVAPVRASSAQFVAQDDTTTPPEISAPAPRRSSTNDQLIRKIELMPAFVLSSFDGGDSSNLIPSGVSSPSNTSFSGAVLTDLSIFGSSNLVGETGLMFTTVGAGTGLTNNNNGFNNNFNSNNTNSVFTEKVTLSYLDVPVNLKYILSGEGNSSFFAKGGVIPGFLVKHDYVSNFTNNEARFGGYNIFDLRFDVGVGYDYKISRSFHAIIDISGFQSVLPVMTNYNVYNYGLMAGLGVGFML